jgi:hypothetical protein
MSQYPVIGRCLCKKVSYAITRATWVSFSIVIARAAGSLPAARSRPTYWCLPLTFSGLSGEEFVGRYELEDAKHFATSFCKQCGSSLPWLGKSGRAVVVPAGSLDGDPEIRPMQNIFCGSRAVWYQEPGALPAYEELPPKPQ